MNARRLASLLVDAVTPSFLRALLTWPCFSVTSFEMLQRLARQGIRAATVIDVGANTGQFAVAAAKILGCERVISFEPQPSCIGCLSKISKALPQIEVRPFALGERVGEVTIKINSHSHSSSILPLSARHLKAFPDAVESGEVSVSMLTLDKAFENEALKEPILLKLDVQGYETFVLKGAIETLNRIKYVVMETSFVPLYDGEATFLQLLDSMNQRGFRFVRPIGFLEDPKSNEILQADVLFVNEKFL